MKRKLAFISGIISSILLIISGSTGFANWTRIKDLVLSYINISIINVSFFIVLIIASLGGISVLIGSFLILKKKYFIGRWLITIGAGVGIISFLLKLFYSIMTSNFAIDYYLTIPSLGILFAIIAQILARKK